MSGSLLMWNIRVFFWKKSYFDNGRLQSQLSFNLISVTHNIKGFHVRNLGPKVNVKFFTVDPYTLLTESHALFPYFRFDRYDTFLGRKNMLFRWCRQKGKSNIDSFFGWFLFFWGYQYIFWKFYKALKFWTQYFEKKYRSLCSFLPTKQCIFFMVSQFFLVNQHVVN